MRRIPFLYMTPFFGQIRTERRSCGRFQEFLLWMFCCWATLERAKRSLETLADWESGEAEMWVRGDHQEAEEATESWTGRVGTRSPNMWRNEV